MLTGLLGPDVMPTKSLPRRRSASTTLPREIKAVTDAEPSLATTMLAAPMSHP
jgi:hypothetical protein